MGRSHGERLLFFATLRVARFCWRCLPEGRLGPPFFPTGKESAAGGVKKGGQGGTKLRPNEMVAIWRGRAAEWMSPAACGRAKDMELARTKWPP